MPDPSRLIEQESFPQEEIVSVRPTKDGKWEVWQGPRALDEAWQREWQVWWLMVGQDLQREHPEWWREE